MSFDLLLTKLLLFEHLSIFTASKLVFALLLLLFVHNDEFFETSVLFVGNGVVLGKMIYGLAR